MGLADTYSRSSESGKPQDLAPGRTPRHQTRGRVLRMCDTGYAYSRMCGIARKPQKRPGAMRIPIQCVLSLCSVALRKIAVFMLVAVYKVLGLRLRTGVVACIAPRPPP